MLLCCKRILSKQAKTPQNPSRVDTMLIDILFQPLGVPKILSSCILLPNQLCNLNRLLRLTGPSEHSYKHKRDVNMSIPVFLRHSKIANFSRQLIRKAQAQYCITIYWNCCLHDFCWIWPQYMFNRYVFGIVFQEHNLQGTYSNNSFSTELYIASLPLKNLHNMNKLSFLEKKKFKLPTSNNLLSVGFLLPIQFPQSETLLLLNLCFLQ